MYKNIDNNSVMLWDIQYCRGDKKAGISDVLYTIYKDLETGKKYVDVRYEPRMDIYFEKPEYRNHSYNKLYASKKELDVKHVKYTDIIKAIVSEGGYSYKRAYNNVLETRNYQELEKFQLAPFAFGTDYDIRTWYRLQWMLQKDNDLIKRIDKGYLDIEVDSIDIEGFPNAQDCPINAVSIVNDRDKEVYLFALVGREFDQSLYDRIPKTKDNEHELLRLQKIKRYYESGLQQQEVLLNNIDGFKQKCHEAFDDLYGYLDYKCYFYREEDKMLIDMFKLINTLKLDTIAIWNMGFDIPYIIERLTVLGLDPKEVMCHPDFPVKKCYYKKDKFHFEIKNKTDFFHLTSYTTFIDDMILYASIRKGAQEYRSYKLNDIAQLELKDTKYDYSSDGDIKTIAYTNYEMFLLYNIKDTLLQCGIERKVSDIDNLYVLSYKNLTSYDSAFKQTVVLRNVQYLYYWNQGLIPGNNINQIINRGNTEEYEEVDDDDTDENEDDKSKAKKKKGFEGALNADPTLNKKNGQMLLGKRTNNIFNTGIDMDMSAFYPSTIDAMNIIASALIFKAIVPMAQFGKDKLSINSFVAENYTEDDLDCARDVFDNFLTRNYLYSGHKWFNLPSVEEVYARLKEEM
jgi:hypothetical protein